MYDLRTQDLGEHVLRVKAGVTGWYTAKDRRQDGGLEDKGRQISHTPRLRSTEQKGNWGISVGQTASQRQEAQVAYDHRGMCCSEFLGAKRGRSPD